MKDTSVTNFLSDLGTEVLHSLRESAQQHLDDAALNEKLIGIDNATMAMLEAGIDKETIIQMLQKYWDLRLSEATSFVNTHLKHLE